MNFYIFCFLIGLALIHSIESYKVDCETQSTDAYRWGTATANLVASIALGIVPPVTISSPPGAGFAVGNAATSLLRYLWPVIIGVNNECISEAIHKMMRNVELLTNSKISNLTTSEIGHWIHSQEDTAKKIYEWIPLVQDSSDPQTQRDASLEYLKELKYLYFSANEIRDVFVKGISPIPETFAYLREIAFLQLSAATEIIVNKYTEPIVKQKFIDDYRRDVEFYWRAGHVAVEKLVKCLPPAQMAKGRALYSQHLLPFYQFAYRFLQGNVSAEYSKSVVYKPIMSGDFVAFRLNSGKLAVFDSIFRTNVEVASEGKCPICGWDLFDSSYSPSSIHSTLSNSFFCRYSVFDIANAKTVGSPIRSCDVVSLNHRFVTEPMNFYSLQTPLFIVYKFDDVFNKKMICGTPIEDRDHVQLEPTTMWRSKVNSIDGIIVKAD